MASITVSMFSFLIIIWVLSRSTSTAATSELQFGNTSYTPDGLNDSHRKLVLSNPEFLYKLYPAGFLIFNKFTKPNLHANKCALLYICILVIIQAHDCQLNPGPNPSNEASRCSVSSNDVPSSNSTSSKSDISDSKFPCHLCHKACL